MKLFHRSLTVDVRFRHEMGSLGQKTNNVMGNLLYIIAVILIIGWVLGAFVWSAGSLIHLLLVLAVVAILLRLIRGDRTV